MAIVWDKATFDTMYTCTGWKWGVRNYPRVPRFHYHWFGQQGMVQAIVDRYQSVPGFNSIQDIAIIGGGFGWAGEALTQLGKNVVTVDTSDYILNNKDTSEEVELRAALAETGFDPDNLPVMIGPDYNTPVDPWSYWLRPDGKRTSVNILGEDLSTTASRRNVRQALGNKVDVIVTEYAIDSMDAGDDAASLTLVERCEQLRPNPSCTVVHIIEPNPSDVVLNVKTAEEWRTLLDANGYTDHRIVASAGVL